MTRSSHVDMWYRRALDPKNLKDQQLKCEAQKSKLTKMLADYYDLEKDPTFKEFVSLHNNKDKRKTWNNEPADEALDVKPKEVVEGTPKLTLKMRGLPFSATKQDIKDFFHPVSIKEIRLVQTAKGRPSGRAFVDFYNESDLKQSLKHHKEYMNNRYVELFVDEGPAVRKSGGAKEEVGIKQLQSLKHYEVGGKGKDESLLDSGRLFVRNLPYSITEEDMTKLFEKYGPLTEVLIPLDKEESHSIGYAFITFIFPEHAVKALEELDGSIFQGRLLHLMPSKNKDVKSINDSKCLLDGVM